MHLLFHCYVQWNGQKSMHKCETMCNTLECLHCISSSALTNTINGQDYLSIVLSLQNRSQIEANAKWRCGINDKNKEKSYIFKMSESFGYILLIHFSSSNISNFQITNHISISNLRSSFNLKWCPSTFVCYVANVLMVSGKLF